MLSRVLVSLHGPFYELAMLQKDALRSHRATTNTAFGGPSVRRAPTFLSLSLTSLVPFAELFRRGPAEGLRAAGPGDGRRGRWEVCPHGVTLCFAHQSAAHAETAALGELPGQQSRGALCLQDSYCLILYIPALHLFIGPSALFSPCSFHAGPAATGEMLAECLVLSLTSI